MKKFLILIMLSAFTMLQSYAYSIKIYNAKGNMIGTAIKSGEDFKIYDLNNKLVTDFDAFYSSEGDPDRKEIKKSKHFASDEDGAYRIIEGTNKPVSSFYSEYNPYRAYHLKVKVYDRTGKFVGYAVTDGTKDFELIDTNGNKLQTSETLYSPPGTPLSSYFNNVKQLFILDMGKYY